ncbi:MAG TPA: riboflavin synthase [Gemmatimonadales bacterium]|nr:riboflavin synthase [Gemmatimonadales bacterium]
MFTGIVTAVGTVRSASPAEGGVELVVDCPYADLVEGESIAVDGACLTVAALEPGGFRAHVVATTLERTRLGELGAGDRVNLERALRAGDRLGGHLVQGHVDGVGTVERLSERADARLLDIRVPPAVAAVSLPLGSVAVDGVSLTINELSEPDLIQVSLIPFTLQHTTLGLRRPGDRVHLEGDTLGKYVKALTTR